MWFPDLTQPATDNELPTINAYEIGHRTSTLAEN
jgi:hypothetical protein